MSLLTLTGAKEKKWREWLHEYVFFENRIVERYKAYRVFVHTALIPFVKKMDTVGSLNKKSQIISQI